MVQKPEKLNKHYQELFVRILRANMPEYDKAEKDLIHSLHFASTNGRGLSLDVGRYKVGRSP